MSKMVAGQCARMDKHSSNRGSITTRLQSEEPAAHAHMQSAQLTFSSWARVQASLRAFILPLFTAKHGSASCGSRYNSLSVLGQRLSRMYRVFQVVLSKSALVKWSTAAAKQWICISIAAQAGKAECN